FTLDLYIAHQFISNIDRDIVVDWCQVSGVLYGKRIPQKLKDKLAMFIAKMHIMILYHTPTCLRIRCYLICECTSFKTTHLEVIGLIHIIYSATSALRPRLPWLQLLGLLVFYS
ncbi:hypothetical protein ACJX0J_015808, partial [Zea mays]